MKGQVSQDPPGTDEPHEETGTGEFGNAGRGAASALEHLKSQRQRRHKRLHGVEAPWPEHDEDDWRQQ